jgi:hypothetical protein
MVALFFRCFLLRGPIRKYRTWRSAARVVTQIKGLCMGTLKLRFLFWPTEFRERYKRTLSDHTPPSFLCDIPSPHQPPIRQQCPYLQQPGHPEWTLLVKHVAGSKRAVSRLDPATCFTNRGQPMENILYGRRPPRSRTPSR